MKQIVLQRRILAIAICIATGAALITNAPVAEAEISFEGATQEPFISTKLEVVLGSGMSRDAAGVKPIDATQTHVRFASDPLSDRIDSSVVFGSGLLWWDMNGPGIFDANGNGYYLQRNGNQVKLLQYSGGSITQIGSTVTVTVSGGDSATIVYDKTSGTLRGAYNGSTVIEGITPTFAGANLSPGIFMKWGNNNLARLSSFESTLENESEDSTDETSSVTLNLTGPSADPFISSELETVLGAGMKISPDGVKPRTQNQTHVRSTRPSHSKTLTASTSFGNGVLWWDMNGPGLFDADGNGYYLQRNGNKVELFQYANGSAVSLASPVAVSVGAQDKCTLELDSATGKLLGRYNGSVIVEKAVSQTDFVDLRPGLFMKWSNSNDATLTSVTLSAGAADPGDGSNPGSGPNPNDTKPYTFVGPKPVITDVSKYQETRILDPEWTYEENFSSGAITEKGFFNHREKAWQGVHPTDSAAVPTDGDNAIMVLNYRQLGEGSDTPEDGWSQLGFNLPFNVQQLEMSYDLYLPNNYVASKFNHKGFVFYSGSYGGVNANIHIGQENWGNGTAGFPHDGATPSLNLGTDGWNMGHSFLSDKAKIYSNNAGQWQRIHVYIELAKEPGDYGRVEVFSNGKLVTGTSHPNLVPRDNTPQGNKQLRYSSSGNYLDKGYILGWMNHAIEERETMYLGVDNFKIKVRSTVGATNNSPAP
ncbi:hypothetical protein [Allohahella sp. A8]|uniref:hypothetical protein n=1 Tax=Allohahella sp. A8 TaxID=3141461 RepID=UPI003A7FEDB5